MTRPDDNDKVGQQHNGRHNDEDIDKDVEDNNDRWRTRSDKLTK